MPGQIPVPLNALRAIEIVARRGALAPAADELGVTPGAVSQHINRAEARLGVNLFERTPRGLQPTPALAAVLPRLSAGFADLEDAVRGLRRNGDSVLTVTVASVFASRWLVWRVGRFAEANRGIELRLVVSNDTVDLRHSDIDCGVRFGGGHWPGVSAERIGGEWYRPVAAPALAARLHRPEDLTSVPVINDTATMLSWRAWWRAAGMAEPPATSGPTFDDPALAFDAAIAGQGVLLAVDMMSADAVSDGRLVRPFPVAAGSGVGYWLVTPPSGQPPARVRAFRDWLRHEVPASANGYLSQVAPPPAGKPGTE